MTSCVLELSTNPDWRATCPPRVYSVKSQCVVSILRQVTQAGRSQYTETTLSTIVRPKSRTVLPTSNKSMWLINFSYSLSFSVQFELRIHPNLRERVTRTPPHSSNKAAHSDFETQRRRHQKSKTGVSVASKKCKKEKNTADLLTGSMSGHCFCSAKKV